MLACNQTFFKIVVLFRILLLLEVRASIPSRYKPILDVNVLYFSYFHRYTVVSRFYFENIPMTYHIKHYFMAIDMYLSSLTIYLFRNVRENILYYIKELINLVPLKWFLVFFSERQYKYSWENHPSRDNILKTLI